MRSLFNLLRGSKAVAVNSASGSRFDRYYGGILRPGAGFPTADEARKDMARYDQSVQQYTWIR